VLTLCVHNVGNCFSFSLVTIITSVFIVLVVSNDLFLQLSFSFNIVFIIFTSFSLYFFGSFDFFSVLLYDLRNGWIVMARNIFRKTISNFLHHTCCFSKSIVYPTHELSVSSVSVGMIRSSFFKMMSI